MVLYLYKLYYDNVNIEQLILNLQYRIDNHMYSIIQFILKHQKIKHLLYIKANNKHPSHL